MAISKKTGIRHADLPKVELARFKDNPGATRAMDQLRSIIETRFGKSGQSTDKAVTWGDLVEAGMVSMPGKNGKPISFPPGGGFIPTFPIEPEDGIPPRPEHVTASPGLATVILQWDEPKFAYFGMAEIWRHTADNLALAQKVGQTTSWVYADEIGGNGGITYFYWVRFVSKKGTNGEYNAANGTPATVSLNPDYVLDLLDGQLTENQFYQGLRDRIDLIDGTNVGSVNARIEDAKTVLNAAISDARDAANQISTDLQQVRNDLNDRMDLADQTAEQLSTTVNTEITERKAAIVGVKGEITDGLAAVRGEIGYVSEDVANLTTEHNNFKAQAETKFEAFADADGAMAAKTALLEAKTNLNANLIPNGGFENGAQGWLSMEAVNGALVFLPLENSQAFALVQGSKWGNFVKEITSAGNLMSPPIKMGWTELNGQILNASADIDPNTLTAGPAFAALGASLFVISPSSGNALNVKYGSNVGLTIDGFTESDSERYKSASILPAANGCTEAEFNSIFAQFPDAALRLIVTVNPRGSNALVALRRIKLELGTTPTPYTADATVQSAHARISEESALRVTNEQAAAIRAEEIESNLDGLSGSVTELSSSITELEQTTTTKITEVEAKTNIKPNLLPNGGFESGLDGWTGFTYWDVVDDPYLGRYISMKPQYMASIGSQTSGYTLTGIKPGQRFTMALDGFVKADSGTLGFDFRFRDAANAMLLQAPSVYIRKEYPEFSIDDSRRYLPEFSTSAVAPAGTVSVEVRFYKLGTGTNITGMGVRRVKFEAGDNPTPYTPDRSLLDANARIRDMDSTIVDLTNNKASAASVSEIAANVATNTANITTAQNAITDLGSSVASDMSAIKTQFTGGSDSTNPDDLVSGLVYNLRRSFSTETEALAESIANVSVGLGEGYDSFKNWDFDTDLEGWTAVGGTLVKTTVGVKIVHGTVANSGMASSLGQNIVGAQYHLVKARVRRLAGTGWEGAVYYSTGSHGFVTTRRKIIPEPDWSLGAQGWLVLEWNMAELTEGGSDWADSTINSIRLDLGNAAGDEFEVDYTSVGRPGPAASRADVKRAEQAAASANQTTATRVDEISSAISSPNTGMLARIANTEIALNDTVTGSVAYQLKELSAEYQTNKASVDQRTTANSNDIASAVDRLEQVETKAGSNESEITRLDNAMTSQEQALAAFETEIQAKTNIGANLLVNGGFENGLENWVVPGYWDVVDSDIYGRHVKMKPQYLTATSSQVTYQVLTGLVPGMKVTYSGDFYIEYLGTPNTGGIGASIQFYAGNTQISNHALTLTNLAVFNDALRYERALTVEVPAGTTATRVRFYKIGTGSNIKGMGVRRLKLELGEQATAYTAEGTLSRAHARIDLANSALTDAQQSIASQFTQVQTQFNEKIATVEGTVTTVSDNVSALAQDMSKLEAKTNANPNLLVNSGFELGFEGWANIAFEAVTDPAFGLCAMLKAANLNDGVARTLTSTKFPAKGGQVYTLSADANYEATAGSSFTLYARVFNSSGTLLTQYTIAYVRGTVFSQNDTERYNKKLTFTAHASATQFDVVVRKAPDVSGATRIGIRRIKLEAGDIATPYTADATAAGAGALIKEVAAVSAGQYETVAGQITQISTTVGEHTAAIELQSQAMDGVYAESTLKLDVNGYVSGFGLVNTGKLSEFNIVSDVFRIVPPASPGEVPKVVFEQGLVNGVNTTVIRRAMIADATISRAMIGDAVIDDAKIANVSAAKVTFGEMSGDRIALNSLNADRVITNTFAAALATISTAYIKSAHVEDGAITNAKIGTAAVKLANIDKASIGALSALTADLGSITSGNLTMNAGYSVIRTNNKLMSDGTNGLFFERQANGNVNIDMVSGASRFYMTPTQMGIVTPGFQAYSDGNVQMQALNVVGTLQIQGNAVSASAAFTSSVTIELQSAAEIIFIAYGAGTGGAYTNVKRNILTISYDGYFLADDNSFGFIQEGSIVNQWIINSHMVMGRVNVGAGFHTFNVSHISVNGSGQTGVAPTPTAIIQIFKR